MIAKYLLVGLIQGVIFVLIAFAIKRKTRLILFIGLVTASLIYVIFALRGDASSAWRFIEIVGVAIFSAIGYLGLRGSFWWLSLGWALHPIWDVALHYFGEGRSFAPTSYTILCLSFDLVTAAYIAYKIIRGTHPAVTPTVQNKTA